MDSSGLDGGDASALGSAALSVRVEAHLAAMQAHQLLTDPQPQARASAALVTNHIAYCHRLEHVHHSIESSVPTWSFMASN